MGFLNKSIYDETASVLLRAKDLAAITSSTNGDTASLTITDNAFAVVVKMKSQDRTTGDETVAFSVEVDADSGMASPVVVASLPAVTDTSGTYILLVDGETAKKLEADAAYIRVVATLAGTTPIVEFASWVNPVFC